MGKLTERQREFLRDRVKYGNGQLSMDGAREHITGRSLEAKGLVEIDGWSMATITPAGRAALEGET